MMNTLQRISVPVPCHEDWSKMTVANDGRFCASCAKNVIDFTSKSNDEIKDILLKSQGQPICGRFRKEQVASVRISIPKSVFFKKMPFRRAFLLVLFTTMGSMLFSCSDDEGQKQAIEAVQVVDMPEDDRFVAGMVILPGDIVYDSNETETSSSNYAEKPFEVDESDVDSAAVDTSYRATSDKPDYTKPYDSLAHPVEFEIR